MRAKYLSLGLTLLFIVAGTALVLLGRSPAARDVWMAGVVIMGAPLVLRTVRAVAAGRLATDVVASLSIVGAVVLAQPLAGLVIVLMQTGGEALERYAEGRASAAVRALEAAAPRVAHRVVGATVEDVAVAHVAIGDTLLLRPGDVIPCDGDVLVGEAELDTSSLTGEPLPVHAAPGTHVLSGMVNGLGSFTMCVAAPAERSQYARIVELVRSAQASKAPLQRLADRYAIWFTPVTVGVCAAAVWITHDWSRALAILVVATPCPLILATPVAIIGGINRAARRFVIVRHGGALEALSTVDTAVFDKTGTITIGKPRLDAVRISSGRDRATVLRYAASVEQLSSHLLARVVVDAVAAEGLAIPPSAEHVESPGQGIRGLVEGHDVRVGSRAFIAAGGSAPAAVEPAPGDSTAAAMLRAYVSIDGRVDAILEYADALRPNLPKLLAELRGAGVSRFVMLSGDHESIAERVGAMAGIAETHGDLLPNDKAQFIEQLRAAGRRTMMIGDGINDAPALSTADVGIALAAGGGGIAAEAADVIILVDSVERVGDAKIIADRTIRIARQSIWAGLALSGVAMIVAAFGGLAPVMGAALQEVIDVTVILNALRTSLTPRTERRALDASAVHAVQHGIRGGGAIPSTPTH